MSEIIDNRAKRIRDLKSIVLRLHAGESSEAVKGQLRTLVQECDAAEIAAMEQELMEGGISVKEIMGMCDLHSEVLAEIVVKRAEEALVAGHPVDTFRRENTALGQKADALEGALEQLVEGADAEAPPSPSLRYARGLYNELMDVQKHYERKENLLFPVLERYGIEGPAKVMWGKDDEVRELLKALGEALRAEGSTVGEWKLVRETVGLPALAALREMINKEEMILLPLSLQTLTENDWGEIHEQSPEIGWCLVDPGEDYHPPRREGAELDAKVAEAVAHDGIALSVAGERARTGAIVFPTGSLEPRQLRAIFETLPVDITFVDAEDTVRFFSEGPSRVFLRPKAVIGRKVQHCHPPSSVDVVERILGDFHAGRQSTAEFWIEFQGRFVHIRYFAMRDEKGDYLGTLEVTQDITHERSLAGERRLLQYD